MGNWKTKCKVSDMSDKQQLDMICIKCGRGVYINKAMICTAKGREQLYLDEVEKRARCKAQGCKGRMRMEKVILGDATGFNAGLT